MTMMQKVQLAKKVVEWFFIFDPFNGCPEDEAWKGTVQMLNEDPQEVADTITEALEELDDPDRYSWLIKEGNALLLQL